MSASETRTYGAEKIGSSRYSDFFTRIDQKHTLLSRPIPGRFRPPRSQEFVDKRAHFW